MPQLTYSETMTAAFAGLIADGRNDTTESWPAHEDIEFGLGLVREGDKVRIPNTSGVPIAGIAASDWFIEQNPALTPAGGVYRTTQTVATLRKGLIWVKIDQDVLINDPVYLRHTGGDEGYFRKDADTANADLVPGAIFRAAATAVSGIALVEINLPV